MFAVGNIFPLLYQLTYRIALVAYVKPMDRLSA